MKSQHQFSLVPSVTVPRTMFDRSHGVKTDFDAGLLVPILCDEILPGDSVKCKMEGFGRLATPIKPILDNMYLDSFFFFVPSRLVWDNNGKFHGEQVDPGDSTDYLIPQVTAPAGGWPYHSVADFFGIPPKVAGKSVNALPFRAHNLIHNEFFRDENLQDSLDVPRGDGPDSPAIYTVNRRGKRHDYFTSCLPWPQKGPSVDIPLGTTAPVIGNGQITQVYTPDSATLRTLRTSGTDDLLHADRNTGNGNTLFSANVGLHADLTSASAATVNQLRQAFQVQKMYERDARGGTRYVEMLKAHFGVTSPDFRLQRPEYLGGGSSMININPIAQTSSTDGTTPQGNLSAMGTINLSGHGFNKSFTEHGYILGYVCVRADLSYQQGLNRMWSRQTRLDFYYPSLANIGEQAVLSEEIYCDGTAADQEVFGYQERHADYRYKPSVICGSLRSQNPTPLDIWHLAQYFTSRPHLNSDFIVDNPPVDRVVAVPSESHILYDADITYLHTRCMPLYAIPGNIDHF